MGTKDAVLLLHGLWMGPWMMSWLSHELSKAGYETSSLSLQSMSESPKAHVERLDRAVNEMQAERVHLIGHSMGGVIVLRYLQSAGDSRLGRAVLLGSPALGCQAALQLDKQFWGGLLGASRELWFGPFPNALEGKIEVGAIAGNHAFGLGPFFVSLEGANDGVVTVEETRIAGLRDHIVLPVGHTELIFSARVETQTAHFLAHGHFNHDE